MSISDFHGKHAFLSNFYPACIKHNGLVFASSEHAYQAAKTLDETERRMVRDCNTPGRAKLAGRRVTKRPDWDEVKIEVMREILKIKFSNPGLLKQLHDTGTEILIEGNTWGDRFWGVCGGVGRNLLGQLLMEIRNGN